MSGEVGWQVRECHRKECMCTRCLVVNLGKLAPCCADLEEEVVMILGEMPALVRKGVFCRAHARFEWKREAFFC